MSKYRTYSRPGCDFDDVHVGSLDRYVVCDGKDIKTAKRIAIVQAYSVRDALADARAKYGEHVHVFYA